MPDPKPAARRVRLGLVLAVVAGVLLLAIALALLNRKTLARDALTGWLKSRGVPAEAQVEALGPTTFRAKIRIGDPNRPDFTADAVEVRYRLGVTGLELQSATLTRPVLRATLHGGAFSVGTLDPLVQEFLKRPPPPGPQPRFTVRGGLLSLDTDYGPVRLAADAVVDDSKLVSLTGTTAPTRLKGPGFDAGLGAARITETTAAGRINLTLDAPLPQLTAGAASARDARLQLKLEAPYPDLARRRGEGALVVSATLAGSDLKVGDNRFGKASAQAGFVGRSTGWIEDLAVRGRATATVQGDAGAAGGGAVRSLRTALVADNLAWSRKGGDRLSADLVANAALDDLALADLRLDALTATARGPVAWDARSGPTATLTASAVGRGGWSGLGAPGAADSPELARLKRAAQRFSLTAPQLAISARGTALTVGLPKPVRLVPDSGGAVELAVAPGATLIGPRPGAFTLTSAGGGLPDVRADVSGLTLGPDGAAAGVHVAAKGAFGMVQSGVLDVAGRLRAGAGRTTFALDRCATVKAQRLELGANDVEALAAQLCPYAGPLLTADARGWRVSARALGVTAAAPFVQARVSGVAVNLTASGRGGAGDTTLRADVITGQIEDTSPAVRFNPLALTGGASLSNYVWNADLAARQPGGQPIGLMHLVHDGGLGVGFMTLDTDTLTFDPAGLQPLQLSPLASVVGSPVTGRARFEGRFDWAREGASSSGSVTLDHLDFKSPIGLVEGLNGSLKFNSLSPLIAEPGQILEIGRIGALVPLEKLHASFSVADNLLKVVGGEALVGGGRILVESLEAPLTADAPTRGVLAFERVQLHDLVEASPFGDKVDLNARVSGRVVFESRGSQVRISEGELKAVEPGRISIDRTALSGVQAEGAVSGPAATAARDPNATVTDMAYQAMENLAFDTLELTLASRRDGRLGALFHIVGFHDPPVKKVIRLSLMDVIRKRFMDKALPLPSGTKVNLTLDTSLNLDDLLQDYADYRQLHGSAQVQPAPANPKP